MFNIGKVPKGIILPCVASDEFSPEDLSNLLIWWKAENLTKSGSDVDAFLDQSGNGWDAEVDETQTKATYSASAVNGNPGVIFTSACERYEYSRTPVLNFLGGAAAFTICGIIEVVSPLTDQVLIGAATGNFDRFSVGIKKGHFAAGIYDGTLRYLSYNNIPAGVYEMIYVRNPSDTDYLYMNTISKTGTNNAPSAPQVVNTWIGASNNDETSVQLWRGKVRELFYYTDAKSGSDLTDLLDYLTARNS